MTTLTVIDGYRPDEGRTAAIARRLREQLAALNISGVGAARLCGVTQPWMSRRLKGSVVFNVDELDMVCETLGIDFAYILTGARELPTSPPPRPRGTGIPAPNERLLLPRLDSNQEPAEPGLAA